MFIFAKGHNADVLNTLKRLSLARQWFAASLKERVAIAATLHELFPTEVICNQLLQICKPSENTLVCHYDTALPVDSSMLALATNDLDHGALALPKCRRARRLQPRQMKFT